MSFKIETKQVTRRVVTDVICNKCGRSCDGRDHSPVGEPHLSYEHAHVTVCWGYGTDKDGDCHDWDLCERCYDELIATFKIPVDKTREVTIQYPNMDWERDSGQDIRK